MKKSEILRVTLLCLDKIQQTSTASFCADAAASSSSSVLLDENDLQVSTICSLWGGMGHIYKVSLRDESHSHPHQQALVIKHVAPPRKNMSFGDRRKADSYQVECNFYERVAPQLIQEFGLSLPEPYLVERDCGKGKNEIVIAMSFVQQEYNQESDSAALLKPVLTWLATLHAAFWGNDRADEIVAQAGLQRTGSYWHLGTRPDEHASMPCRGWEGRLKRAALALDEYLRERDPLQCIIHGDAKEANILVSSAPRQDDDDDSKQPQSKVTLCDFQYCGKGTPTRDLAYFFCSSVSPENEKAALEFYLQELTKRLPDDVAPPTMQELSDSLELAYCDYYRFMSGWGYWGSGGGDERVKAVLNRLDNGKDLGSEEAYDEAVRREYG